MAKAKKVNPWVASLVVGVLLLVGLLALGIPQSFQADEVRPGDISSCDSTTTPELTISSYDIENPGTELTEGTNLYKAEGDTIWSTFTAGTGFAVDVGDTLNIVMGITTSDFTDNAYGDKFEYTVPCSETPSVEKGVYNDEVETSLTATFYNADADAGAEGFSAGQTQDVSIKLQSGVDEYFGNPFIAGNPNVIVLDLNTTEWDAPEKVSVDGVDLKKVSTPIRHSAVAGIVAYAYELPVISDSTTEVVLKLNADDSNAPATDMTAYMYAGNWFINGDTAEVEFGVENEEGTAVGTDASDSVSLDFTV